jgi:hypothetical protein
MRPAQFSYAVIHVGSFESHVHFADWCVCVSRFPAARMHVKYLITGCCLFSRWILFFKLELYISCKFGEIEHHIAYVVSCC